jgi:hypothetical protein
MDLGKINIERKSGDEPFHRNGESLAFNVLSFWQWSASKLLTNAQRGVLAEYLVAQATGSAKGVRDTWSAFDLCTPSGTKVEVKSAAYLQSWTQETYSSIRFDISESQSLDAGSTGAKRHSDVYVFCLLHHKEQRTVDPTDLSQWTFYVLPTRTLDEKRPGQKTIGLSGLEALGADDVSFEALGAAVRRARP